MATPIQEDPISKGVGRLLSQYQDKPNIVGTLTTYLKQINSLELSWFQLLNDRSDLTTVTGQQLDVLGNTVGEPRNGRNDDDYRVGINFKIGVNNSQATPEYLTQLCKDITSSSTVNYFEFYPAAYSIEFNGDFIPDNFIQGFIDASPSTVNPSLIHNINNNGLIFSEQGDSSPQADFGILPESGDINGLYFSEGYSREEVPITPVVPVTPNPKDALKTVFSVKTQAGTGNLLQTVTNGLDMASTDSAVMAWKKGIFPISNSIQIDGFDTNGYKRWFEINSLTNNLNLTKNSTGFTISTSSGSQQEFDWNTSGSDWHYISFLKQSGFCDIILYTGDGQISQQIPHNLGFVPSYVCCSRNGTGNDIYRFKDMPTNQAFSQNNIVSSAAVWGGSNPTTTHVTVGDIGGSNSPNVLGQEYVMIVFADNPSGYAVTSGSYSGNSIAGTEIDLGNDVGLFFVKGFHNTDGVFYCSDSVPIGKNSGAGAETTAIQVLNQDGTKVVLSSEATVNQSGITYYWLNIANPNT